MNCYKVMCSKNGKRQCSHTFNDYDTAFDFAIKESDSKGFLCVLLVFDAKQGCWRKRCFIYPNETM